MASTFETLCAIEQRAERAVVQELRLLVQDVQSLQTSLSGDELAHANALLLKLDQLRQNQLAEGVGNLPFIEAPELNFDFL